ncbi:hypothetical protein [Streptomyces sp. DSM 41634]|uniref:hypothetical protein n=1 Tax=Streptomyces sp. DSM 41634 TaxID=3448656 RepID=UPI00403FF360
MTTTINDDLVVTGALSAANIIMGSVVMNPEVNVVTSTEVKFNHPSADPAPNVMITAVSQDPWTKIRELGTRFSSATGVTIYIYRTNDVDTTINWLSWQEPNI